ncbi:hypothetical protein [Aquimarina sp. 2201CG5-10]|uniref:hypothetical protein n=1 Tax=Aquimarina callyspongiae TaxID=3098150 RepID=UPI002AB4D3B5|nr:hypothetical protein [Aquimarina sp. 2201CG5-10]MDY8134805.1 hypothetical protein [Aquimarina sp. 2201CG5-10]
MKELTLPQYNLVFKESHAILVMQKGFAVTVEIAEEITKHLEEYYNGRDFIFLTHRKFFHDIDLNVYKGRILKNMIGYGIVSDDPLEAKRAMHEQSLWNEAFTFFEQLEEAENWAGSFFN